MAYTRNTWATGDIITADKLNNLENGLASTNTRRATFTDFSQVATNMITYSGQWHIQYGEIANGPKNDMTWTVVSVITGNGPQTGLIITSTYLENIIYYTTVDNGIIRGWNKLPKDSTLVHNTGTETVSGDKTFTGNTNFAGQTTLKTGNYGLRVTTAGIQKTSDGGTTWTNI